MQFFFLFFLFFSPFYKDREQTWKIAESGQANPTSPAPGCISTHYPALYGSFNATSHWASPQWASPSHIFLGHHLDYFVWLDVAKRYGIQKKLHSTGIRSEDIHRIDARLGRIICSSIYRYLVTGRWLYRFHSATCFGAHPYFASLSYLWRTKRYTECHYTWWKWRARMDETNDQQCLWPLWYHAFCLQHT